MPLTQEELEEKQQIILTFASQYEGADENRITVDKEDAKIIREMLLNNLLRREFGHAGGKNGFGFRLFITEKGKQKMIHDDSD